MSLAVATGDQPAGLWRSAEFNVTVPILDRDKTARKTPLQLILFFNSL